MCQQFEPPKSGKIAAMVINHSGDEVLTVYPLPVKISTSLRKAK